MNHATPSDATRHPGYDTLHGEMRVGDCERLAHDLVPGSVDLIVTSPPFALTRRKDYGNPDQDEYVDWLVSKLAPLVPALAPTGSMVVDLGGAYEPGRPTRSLAPYRAMIALCDGLGLELSQEFFWYNPARMPSPAQWVNIDRVRVKDAVDFVPWLSRGRPKADNRKVLKDYSESQARLMRSGSSPAAVRPSGHTVGDGFLEDRGGAIPSNLLVFPNTESSGPYQSRMRDLGVAPHPARFPEHLPRFFVRFLTDPGDVVLDPFAGSNTTGAVAQSEGRRWIGFEERADYAACSALRFLSPELPDGEVAGIHAAIASGGHVRLPEGLFDPRPCHEVAPDPQPNLL